MTFKKLTRAGIIALALLVVINVERDLTIFIPAFFFCQLLSIYLMAAYNPHGLGSI